MAQVSYGQMTIADLTDNYQVQLSPESASFAGGTSSAKDGSITVIVSTLQGNKRIAHTIGNPTGLPQDGSMTVTDKTPGSKTADGSFKVNITTAFTPTSGYFTIPITVDGVVYNRRFSYSVGREGTSVTITDKSVTYQVGSSGTTAPTGTWQNTVQTPAENQYLWTKTEVTYSDGNKTVAYSVSRNAKNGVSPTATKTQTEYQQSTNGTTPPTGTWLTSAPDAIAGQYMWTRVTVTYSDSATSISYSVSRNGADGTSVFIESATKSGDTTTVVIKDTDGNTETLTIVDGTDGKNGTNGKTGYVHTAWANSADGSTDFSTTVSANKKYLGVYTDNTEADSTSPSAYSWSLIKGADGVSVSNVTSSKSGDTTTITITYSDGRTPSTFTVKDGAQGGKGDTGATAQWYFGDKLSHTSGTATLATSQTTGVVVGSMYLNPDTSLCYRCTAISGSNATWTYAGDLTTGVINNIEVGGRNLAWNSKLLNIQNGQQKKYISKRRGTDIIVTRDDGFGEIHSYGSSFGGMGIYSSLFDFQVGDVLTLSFYAKYVGNLNTPYISFYPMMYKNGSRNTSIKIPISFDGGSYVEANAKRWVNKDGSYRNLTTSYEKYSVTFIWTQEVADLDYVEITAQALATTWTDTSSNSYIAIYMPKLEHGNIATDWSPAPEDTEAAIVNLTELTDSLQNQIDSKIETWTQVADPATGWNTDVLKKSHVGDLWYYIGETTTNPSRKNNTTYKYTLSGSTYSWSEYVNGTDMTGVFDKIDGKSTIFYGTTAGTYTGVQKGDYLVDSTTGNTYRYDPTVTTNNHWVKVTDYKTGIDEAKQDVVDLDESLNQQEVFNRLTNNGQAQGLYIDNGNVYINATYIQSGEINADLITTGHMSASRIKGDTLTLGGNNNVNGSLSILNSNSTVIGKWDNTGITATNADISGKITAISGSIGGFNIINTNDSTKTTANGGHSYANSLYKITNDGTYEYEVGMKASSGSTDLAFYVKRIPLGEAWNSSNLTNLFYVANNGALYASNATIDGKFTCTNTEIRSTLTIEDGVITGRWDNQETFIDLNNCQYIGGTSRGTIGLFSDDQIALYARDTIFSWGKSVLIMAGDYDNVGYRYNTGVNDYSVKICTGATGNVYYEFQTDGVFKTVGLVVKTGIEIAYSTPYIDFHFNNSTADYTSRLIETSSGVLDLKKSGGTYGTIRAVISNQSSIHVKRNITDISSDDANKLLSLRPVEFDYKWGQHDYGMIAEEVYEYLPNLVTIPDGFDADTYEYKNMDDQVPSLRYQQFIPYIIKLLQNQQAEINELKGRNLQ